MKKQNMSANPMRDIKIPDGSKLWFTSDTHFWHQNIIRWCARPWETASEMNDAMVDLWNSEVPKDADVWHLGDFCFAGAAQWKDLRDRLNGHIHLVLGNHDGVASGPMLSLFDSIHPGIAHLRVENQQEIWLSHFPLLCWTGCSRGAWNLFGHVHTMATDPQLGEDSGRVSSCRLWNQYDVGVDQNHYKPVSYSYLKTIIKDDRENQRTDGAQTP
jgi:calcineurin-like phosphoesterase family protein